MLSLSVFSCMAAVARWSARAECGRIDRCSDGSRSYHVILTPSKRWSSSSGQPSTCHRTPRTVRGAGLPGGGGGGTAAVGGVCAHTHTPSYITVVGRCWCCCWVSSAITLLPPPIPLAHNCQHVSAPATRHQRRRPLYIATRRACGAAWGQHAYDVTHTQARARVRAFLGTPLN